MNSFFKTQAPLVYGHRGYSAKAPENTMESFDLCLRQNIPAIELDIHLSRDNKLYVIHDSNLKRTTGIDAIIEDMEASKIDEADASYIKRDEFSNLRIPLLQEVLSSYRDRFIYDIELKWGKDKDRNKLLCSLAYEMVKVYKLEEFVSFSSFNPLVLRMMSNLTKRRIPSADIYAQDYNVPKILQNGFGHVVSRSTYEKPEYKIVDQDFMRKHKRPVVVWTVNDADNARRLKALGVSAIISNDPTLVIKA